MSAWIAVPCLAAWGVRQAVWSARSPEARLTATIAGSMNALTAANAAASRWLCRPRRPEELAR
ncbi:hypothetical protein PV367_05145 [Streptomyces europaeiscabiei]|uniref:Uncharacterized protein n=1 Tax=Streptomyces europaeiscabiei TaxID=146819 RepID=A0AAJ2PKH2_9ACTN|nr:hypothetical protein [Streptomyces europaeiscabiei]MDX3129200.1 hypothetical protein [Streptomyces europaeiscabiei]